jgi:magnesium transporter
VGQRSFAVPTAIAGIYGMNFGHVPVLKTLYGHDVVLVAILVTCAGLFVPFKRVKWL